MKVSDYENPDKYKEYESLPVDVRNGDGTVKIIAGQFTLVLSPENANGLLAKLAKTLQGIDKPNRAVPS